MAVRPGLLRTAMTAGLAEAPFAVGPADVESAVVCGLETNAAVVRVPPILRGVFAGVSLLPPPIFPRLPG